MKIQPVGSKLLILPLPKKEYKLESIVIAATANGELSEGQVVEVSETLKEVYPIGCKVLYPESVGIGQIYNGKPHLWLDSSLDQVWGIVTED